MITLTPNIKLRITGNLLSLNDNDLILANGIIADIKINKDKRCVYKLVNELENEENLFIGGGDSKMILINTTNPLKKKAINRVLNISDDKLEEVINIIDMINAPEVKVDDVKNIRFLIGGGIQAKENHIESTYDKEEMLSYFKTLIEVLDIIDNR